MYFENFGQPRSESCRKFSFAIDIPFRSETTQANQSVQIILAGESFSVSKSGKESSICYLWRNFAILTASFVRITPNMYQAAVHAYFSWKLRKWHCPRAVVISSLIYFALWKQPGESVLWNTFALQTKREPAILLHQSKVFNQKQWSIAV